MPQFGATVLSTHYAFNKFNKTISPYSLFVNRYFLPEAHMRAMKIVGSY